MIGYVDIDYTNLYVRGRHKVDPLRIFWEALDDEDKQAFLMQSLQEIESIPISGQRLGYNQKLQFPRIDGIYRIPEQVMQAQVENALAFMDKEISEQSGRQMQILNSLGVVVNPKYVRGLNYEGTKEHSLLTSPIASRLMEQFIGTYRM